MGRFAGEGKGPVGAGERAGLAPGLGLRWRASWAGVGRPGWVGLKFSFPISIFPLFSNSNKLNPNESKFEFEFTQALKQIKPMLQHDASTKFKLMIKF